MVQVVVLAAGGGSRLYPFSNLIPKIMFPIGKDKKTVADFIIEHCKSYGLKDFIFCINKDSGKYIKNYLKDGKHLGVNIKYSESDYPLGTAGEIRKAYETGLIEEDFVLYYGDTLCKINLTDFLIQNRDCMVGITIHDTTIPVGFVVSYNGYLDKIIEKPKISEMFNEDADYGAILPVFYVTSSIPSLCNIGEDFVQDVVSKISKQYINVYKYEGEFLDMGNWKSYKESETWK